MLDVIITGASSGIGKEFAKKIDQMGYRRIFLIARNKTKLEELSKMLKTPCVIASCDLTKNESFTYLKTVLDENNANIGLLVNGAGFGIFNEFTSTDINDVNGMIDLNDKALVNMTYLTLNYMQENAKIINIASIASFEPIPYGAIYGASKSFVLSFSRALNMELKKKKICVLAVCPYWTATGFFDRGNKNGVIKKFDCMYSPEFVVKKTFKALKGKKDYVVTGTYAKFVRFLAKILPNKWIMKMFMKKQSLK